MCVCLCVCMTPPYKGVRVCVYLYQKERNAGDRQRPIFDYIYHLMGMAIKLPPHRDRTMNLRSIALLTHKHIHIRTYGQSHIHTISPPHHTLRFLLASPRDAMFAVLRSLFAFRSYTRRSRASTSSDREVLTTTIQVRFCFKMLCYAIKRSSSIEAKECML